MLAQTDGPAAHDVMFYDGDDELVEAVRGYVVAGLKSGDATVVVATAAHASALEVALHASDIDPDAARQEGLLLCLDARILLGRFMAGDRPRADAFDAEVGTILRRAGASGRGVRVFGEMVAVLWEDGNVLAAIELEDLWNRLLRRLSFALLCAYRAGAVSDDGHAGAFAEVCHLHSAVCGPGNPRRRIVETREFPAAARSAQDARRFVASALRGWGDERLAFDVALVVTELATNALTHSGSAFVVGVSVMAREARVWVRDSSAAVPVRHHPDRLADHGRGLALVDAIATRWGYDAVEGGKVVWASLPGEAPPAVAL
jgi:anti-sigma regulatory factor (Ser/Thr protein kinase)